MRRRGKKNQHTHEAQVTCYAMSNKVIYFWPRNLVTPANIWAKSNSVSMEMDFSLFSVIFIYTFPIIHPLVYKFNMIVNYLLSQLAMASSWPALTQHLPNAHSFTWWPAYNMCSKGEYINSPNETPHFKFSRCFCKHACVSITCMFL